MKVGLAIAELLVITTSFCTALGCRVALTRERRMQLDTG